MKIPLPPHGQGSLVTVEAKGRKLQHREVVHRTGNGTSRPEEDDPGTNSLSCVASAVEWPPRKQSRSELRKEPPTRKQ
jgi:hypothetical protein